MEFQLRLPKFNQIESRKWLIFLVAVAIAHLLLQPLLFPYGYTIRSLLPTASDSMFDQSGMVVKEQSSVNSGISRNALAVDASISTASLKIEFIPKNDNKTDGVKRLDRDTDDEEEDLDDEPAELGLYRDVGVVVDDDDDAKDASLENFVGGNEVTLERNSVLEFPSEAIKHLPHDKNVTTKNSEEQTSVSMGFPEHPSTILEAPHVNSQVVPPSPTTSDAPLEANEGPSAIPAVIKGASVFPTDNSARASSPLKKQIKSEMPPKSIMTIDEMNDLLAQRRHSSRAMRPRWSSVRDQEILAARSKIENAPAIVNDQDLYAPLFRNVSQFKRSYELMERTLKVYIYKDGNKPIFHLPILKGLYASEGWFMKLMQGSRQFVVKDPQKAHLFYMPFSSRMLEYSLYVRNSHNRTNLRQHLKEYTEKIAAKYPYWNRTGGADHFLVACHDWAPYETRHHMEHCIKALCNADVTVGFKLGRDVSLAETFIRAARNPLRSLGGKLPSQRHILAFYAGGMHGYLRPLLVKHWKDKEPDMKIYGPMPAAVSSKMSYIQHMKSSKYCICPKGFEVNSPRVVESIFYECVPVIISDNFVPPLFEVFNWSAFSIILPEKDIPNLKQILLLIPEKRYIELQLAVRKVQKHFLWHGRPVKYDLFHMTLHSIWYNRVYQIKPR
ncbi:Probable glycosyltransferase At5g03795 [Linum perenne]